MNELVVSRTEDGLRIAVLRDKRILELHHEKLVDAFSVGDVILGKVKKVVQGLNAAFVDVGHPRDGFLHYTDLGPQILSMRKYLRAARAARGNTSHKYLENIQAVDDIDKNGSMKDVLKTNQEILVQVVKEPISTKGPRLSSEVSLPGQYVVLVPFSPAVSVSKKIRSSEERRRLKVLAESICPKNFGVIVRTAAEGQDAASLSMDIQNILDKWKAMTTALANARPRAKVLSEQNRATSILRDTLSMGFDNIHVDDEATYDGIKEYLQSTQPEYLKMLKRHKSKVPMFQHLGLEKQIKAAFGKIVSLPNGAYLVIESTEAMNVIDVNSGSKNLNNDSLEETALHTNMLAAEELARQLRLRDMGGIIVVDFIDMRKAENRRKLNDFIRSEMKSDRARHTILPVSRFGLVQITRQRVRPLLDITTSEVCPTCSGSGKIQASILIADQIKDKVDFIMRQNQEKKMHVVVNPFVAAYLTKGLFKSPQWKWFFDYKKWIKVLPDTSMPFTEVKYYNARDEEIQV
ncbi:MAG: Rne/Rng family ribonuclease [Bacteroidia bacterium]